MAQLETIEYLPPRDTDEVGDPVGPVPESVPIPGCKLWPRTSVESGTEVIVEGYGVKTPRTAPAMSAKGTVKARGQTWEIDGVPGFFPGKGYIVYLKRFGS